MLSLIAAVVLQPNLAPIEIREALVIDGVARGGRVAFPTDALVAALNEGTLQPKEGERLAERTWRKVLATNEGWIRGTGYAVATVSSPSGGSAVLEAAGHSLVYVNREPRMGDPYATGTVSIPVHLKAGENELIFAMGRGQVRAKLRPARATLELDAADPTLPDLRLGEKGRFFGAILLRNTSPTPQRAGRIRARLGAGAWVETATPAMPPTSIRKVRIDFAATGREPAGEEKLTVELGSEAVTLPVRIRKRDETYKRTFVSGIDGSVQYYAVRPAKVERPGLPMILSLHGASVEAIGQADAYGPNESPIVCPTNRRPFGFDWEGWGRMDAIEVLEHAQQELKTDPKRVFLTGHSMGGHGVWTVGAHHPDRFIAFGAAASWLSFYTYTGKPRPPKDDEMAQFFERAGAFTDTELLFSNFKDRPVSILHGDADETVPVSEARRMREMLRALDTEPAYHEEPRQGHWYDTDPAPGANCVDWPPFWDLFRWAQMPSRDGITFTTVSPAQSSRAWGIEIRGQIVPHAPSSVTMKRNGGLWVVTTSNVRELGLEKLDGPVTIDGAYFPTLTADWRSFQIRESLEMLNGPKAWVEGAGRRPVWSRYGLRTAFTNRFALVYGTKGTPEENAWAYAKARYDAEQWWVRGNGSVDLLSDEEALARRNERRNWILYGSPRANSASVLSSHVELPGSAAGLGVAELRPGRRGNAVLLFYGDTPLARRALDRLPMFVSGVGYPDWMRVRPSIWTEGVRGVEIAGFLDDNWRANPAQTLRRAP